MVDLSEQLEAERENIERTLDLLDATLGRQPKTDIELAAMATYLHNFYSGIESILKRIAVEHNLIVPKSDTWHRDLIDLVTKNGFLSEDNAGRLREYLAFRHFFVHGYGFQLKEELLAGLATGARNFWNLTYPQLKKALRV